MNQAIVQLVSTNALAQQDSHSELLMREVIERFTELKNSVHTQRSYKSDIVSFFDGLNVEVVFLADLGLIPYPQVVDQVNAFLKANTKTDEKTNRVLNAKTVNRKAYALSSFFNHLIQVYNYPKNPVRNITPLKMEKRSTTTSLTRAEVIDFLEFAKGQHRLSETKFRNYLIVVFLFALALRRDEVANLKWDDVDFSQQTVNVYQKGGSYKLLPLPNNITQSLQEFKRLYGDSCPYVFHPVRNNSTKELNKPIGSEYIFEMVQKMASQVVPNKKITPHSFRKTFIELALNNKEDFISIINATGHATVEMVKYYDTRDTLKNNAIHSIANII
jgi:integrase/recombinase XerC